MPTSTMLPFFTGRMPFLPPNQQSFKALKANALKLMENLGFHGISRKCVLFTEDIQFQRTCRGREIVKYFGRYVSICVIFNDMTLGTFVTFLWLPYGIGRAIIFLPCDFYLSSSFFPRLISAVGDWMHTILPHMVWP